ncbi:hypothetical protein MKW94_017315 [Papaver nudicaule]|uniref:RING-type E3 ubiquitin transferase n=1 Tax=Papaver nudicaule TaxID=74823 RepID=A0AA41S263_PAPNU|nr:hypothetical protein [Papaver nudicaule]
MQCPQALEERQSLSVSVAASSALSAGLLVDTNLDTSTPATYRSPPAPMRYDTDLGRPQTKCLLVDCKNETDYVPPSPKKPDDPGKLKDLTSSPTEEEDCCPTCLEEYDDESPRIITKCEHRFHLSCILEWMERSDTCPVCDQEMVLDQTVYNM